MRRGHAALLWTMLCFGIAALILGLVAVSLCCKSEQEPVIGVALDAGGRCVSAYRLDHFGEQHAPGDPLAGDAVVCWEAWTSCSEEDFVHAAVQSSDGSSPAASALLRLGESSLCAASLGLAEVDDHFGPLRYPGGEVKRQHPDKRRRFSSNSAKSSASTSLPSSSSASQASSASLS